MSIKPREGDLVSFGSSGWWQKIIESKDTHLMSYVLVDSDIPAFLMSGSWFAHVDPCGAGQVLLPKEYIE